MPTVAPSPFHRFDEPKHEYFGGDVRYDSPSRVLKRLGFIYEAPPWYLIRGSGIHLALHVHLMALAQGKRLAIESVDERIIGPVQSGVRWIDKYVERVDGTEERLYKDIYQLGGTLDLRCNLRGDNTPWIIDFKGGKAPKWGGFQTGAYDILAGGGHRRACLEVQEDGTLANLVPHNDTNDGQAFLSLLNAARIFDRLHIGESNGNERTIS